MGKKREPREVVGAMEGVGRSLVVDAEWKMRPPAYAFAIPKDVLGAACGSFASRSTSAMTSAASLSAAGGLC